MTTRRDVAALAAAGRGVVSLAQRDLAAFFSSLNLSNPEAVRDALIDFVPRLVQVYGDVAATVAAEWYETVRAREIGGAYNAITVPPIADDAPVGSVRYASGHLFTDYPQQALAVLGGSVQRFVLYSSRGTVARNAEHDPAKPRFARVPTGVKTCAWCSMLASRGFVYRTADLGGSGGDFHDECDCQVVSEWDKDAHHIAGYDPDHLYGMYQQAQQAADGATDADIAFEMRRMFPDEFTDGVIAA